ncbi:MAG: hypothetical protein LC122_02615 [Chitinophagales bacterium]|nr:hypothetical protein [Chitinophagales bacterium]
MKVYLVTRSCIAPIGMPIKTLDNEKAFNAFDSKEKADKYIEECEKKSNDYNSSFIDGIQFCFDVGKKFYVEYIKTVKNSMWTTNAIADHITSEIAKTDKKIINDVCIHIIAVAHFIIDDVDFNNKESIESRFFYCMIRDSYSIEEIDVK